MALLVNVLYLANVNYTYLYWRMDYDNYIDLIAADILRSCSGGQLHVQSRRDQDEEEGSVQVL